jgi:integrase
MQAKSQFALVVPTGEKRAVSAGRRSNADYRKREYLTPAEIEKLIEAAKGNRYGHRDATMILVAFRHSFRASEIIELEWSDIDFNAAEMHVERRKRGRSPRHPIRGDELRALRRLHKEQDSKSAFVFVSERGAPFTRDGFNWMVKRAGKKADLPFQVHSHMLRHSTGYKLANDGADTRSIQSYLGHRDIRHTVRYTELSAKPFRDFFRD